MPISSPRQCRRAATGRRALRNEDGLIDPEKLAAAVFSDVNHALDAVREDSMRRIDLSNVEFELPEAGSVKLVTIANATVLQSGPGSMEFSSEAEVDGRALTVTASATRDTTSHARHRLECSHRHGGYAGDNAGGRRENSARSP